MTTFEAATPLGAVRGTEAGGLLHFTGIPYAQPPVGALRFAAPEPAVPWSGVLDATGGPVVAPQGPSRLVGAVGEFSADQSEDCLQVSVTTPAVDGARRPVMVWLHGGGFSSGGGALDWYDGSTLAREGGVVVVGVNYRLGPLGYLRVDGVGDGNAGLLDMVEALRWVRDNIEAFGGDPDNVTVFGQSAGGLCTLLMLTMPGARELFHRAILQSPPAGVLPLTSREAERNAALLHDALGYPALDSAALRQRLSGESTGRLLTAARLVARESAVLGGVAPPYLPVADGFESTDVLLSAAARGAAEAGIPLIVGTTRDEAWAMVYGQAAAEATREQVQQFVDSDPTGRTPRDALSAAEVLVDVMTDRWFTVPAHSFAHAVAAAGCKVWVYRLDWAPAGSPLGACHCLELPLVFGTADAWAAAPMLAGADPAEQEALSARIRGNWLSFAATGEPAGDLPWPSYDDGRSTMIFDTRSGVVRDPVGLDL
ncbi:carboxylesterase/lipase family protein [Kribbella speibonae]|uniref:Carboxylic ester hydrolase n=1 Tax=Kribbella speibonae TaxID=1572660 RepID=A0A4V6N445_9ACTN|nr:carboxylesterase family protein [Kribbella speibonae]TCC21989.1 carboxylesterase/lipase family protein [Kribbella speibonae]TCC34272.1 carboxylesterase/lipase family protein [Kribbella speibonae]